MHGHSRKQHDDWRSDRTGQASLDDRERIVDRNDALACDFLAKELGLLLVDRRGREGNPTRSVQEPARIAWNFSTTLYFKGARLQPWQLADVRPRVCYVGLVFKEDPSKQEGDACCAAQMFLNSGNGVVFRGALGPWRSPKSREFHLRQNAAKDLVGEVIKAYTRDHGAPPDELFIHAKQRFNDEEWGGFASAVPATTKLVGVRIRPTQDLRLFRPDTDMPVLRGTAVTMSRREGYLWTTGYVPRLRTYPGF